MFFACSDYIRDFPASPDDHRKPTGRPEDSHRLLQRTSFITRMIFILIRQTGGDLSIRASQPPQWLTLIGMLTQPEIEMQNA